MTQYYRKCHLAILNQYLCQLCSKVVRVTSANAA
jgi:hypothetical protein